MHVKPQLADYQVIPSIMKVGAKTQIQIRPLGAHAAFGEAVYAVQFLPMNESREPAFDYDTMDVAVSDDGCLRFSYTFSGEQMYIVRLFRMDDVTVEGVRKYGKSRKMMDFHVYALREDLYALRPYRGDLHVHSACSDGREAPEIVAANYRKKGFDFFALTDHHLYEPSVQCKAYYADKPIDLEIIKGEEVHPAGNHIHMVHVGGEKSVNTLVRDDPAMYQAEVAALMESLAIPDGVNAFEYASCVWSFGKMREFGGMAIYPHPHWTSDVYHTPDAMSEALFRAKVFDAFELLGGNEPSENNLQVAFYQNMAAKGYRMPVVGSSDSHGTERDWLFGWLTSIVFAESAAAEDVMAAVKAYRSVAVEAYPNETVRVYGDYRLVMYAQFLLEEYFPLHDELCFEEGRLMKEMFLGDKKAEALLRLMKGRTDILRQSYWGVI